MFSRVELRKWISSRFCCAFLLLLCIHSLTGCQLHLNGNSKSWWKKPVCNLPSEPSKDEVINRINSQVELVNSWHCPQSTIKLKGGPVGIPLRLSANIAVEKPMNFRMIISTSLSGPEADLGSNDNQFWFWARRNEPKFVFTCSHEEIRIARDKLQLPFQPEWLMEVMGVVPLNSEEYILQKPDEPNGILSLVSVKTLENGAQFKRVVLVDSCYGRIIAHELRDPYDNLIAHADLNNYKKIGRSKIALPHQIDLILNPPNAPQTKMQITLKNVKVNLGSQALAHRWSKPRYAGFPEFDLARNFRHEYRTVHATESDRVPERHADLRADTSSQGDYPAWIKKGEREFIIPDSRMRRVSNPNQFKQNPYNQTGSEFVIPDENQTENGDNIFIPDEAQSGINLKEEPDWSE